jgi:hypothetical protein
VSVYLPCLNVDAGNSPQGSGVQVISANSLASSGVSLASAAIQLYAGGELLYLNPVTAVIAFAINYQFWLDLFGLGETRIDREKATIQAVMTPILQYLNINYGVPITDFHALDFPADGVQQQFNNRPDIAALAPSFLVDAPSLAKSVFVQGIPTAGQDQRVVNQLLANAAYNGWPASATQAIWSGLVASAQPTCSADPNRWLQNPQIVRTAAVGGALLRYIPLSVLADMAVGHHIGDPLLENLILLWRSNPQLVSYVSSVFGLPWQDIYTEGTWALPPYGGLFGAVVPLLQRDHIIPIVQSVSVPFVRYPDFGGSQAPAPAPAPQPPTLPPAQQPSPPPPTQGPSPTPAPQPGGGPPTQQPPTVEIPPVAQQPTYTQAQLDYACNIAGLLYGNSQLTDSELGWYNDPSNIALLNLQLNNPQCKQPIIRQQPQPPPPTQTQGQQPQQPTYTQSQLDMACHISRLLYGNAVLTPTEQAWYDDVNNIPVLNAQLNNPQCKLPLLRQDPQQPAVPSTCIIPSQPQPSPVPQQPGQQPGQQAPPSQGQGQPPSQQGPCPPDCQHQIDVVRQKQDDCCDQLHLVVLPRLLDVERWVWDLERRVPGPPPALPFPEPIPPTGEIPGTPTPFPPPDEPPTVVLPPVVDCDSPFVQSLLDCILKKLPPLDRVKKFFIDACSFGKSVWGYMAECWLDANTPQPTVPLAIPPRLQSLGAISDQIDAVLLGEGSSTWDDGLQYAGDLIDGALLGNNQLAQWPYTPNDALPPYLFADPALGAKVEIPITEETT